MLHRMLFIFAACSFAVVMATADDKSASDAKKLQGAWQAIHLKADENDGQQGHVVVFDAPPTFQGTFLR